MCVKIFGCQIILLYFLEMHFNDIVANIMDIIQDVLGHPSISCFGLFNNQPVLRVDTVVAISFVLILIAALLHMYLVRINCFFIQRFTSLILGSRVSIFRTAGSACQKTAL